MNCQNSALIALALILSACMKQNQSAVATTKRHPTEMDTSMVRKEIAASARSIERIWAKLGWLEQTRTVGGMQSEPGAALLARSAPVLRQTLSLDWSGELVDLLRHLAGRLAYRLEVRGQRPAMPIIISIHVRGEPIATVLQEAGWQAGGRAGVVVHGADRRIELIYADAGQGGDEDGWY